MADEIDTGYSETDDGSIDTFYSEVDNLEIIPAVFVAAIASAVTVL